MYEYECVHVCVCVCMCVYMCECVFASVCVCVYNSLHFVFMRKIEAMRCQPDRVRNRTNANGRSSGQIVDLDSANGSFYQNFLLDLSQIRLGVFFL